VAGVSDATIKSCAFKVDLPLHQILAVSGDLYLFRSIRFWPCPVTCTCSSSLTPTRALRFSLGLRSPGVSNAGYPLL
jgi:hypothetical protein